MMSTDLQNLAGLVEQIKAAAPAAEAGPSATAAAADSEDVRALRSELDSVRQELRRAVAPRSNAGDTAGSAAGLPALAPLPAEVLPLPPHLRPTADMLALKQMLLATGASGDSSTTAVTSERAKVGALGMGGIVRAPSARPARKLRKRCSQHVGVSNRGLCLIEALGGDRRGRRWRRRGWRATATSGRTSMRSSGPRSGPARGV